MPEYDSYAPGASVFVFHDAVEAAGGWFAVRCASDGAGTPQRGFTHAWHRATIVQDWTPEGFTEADPTTWPQVELGPTLWYDREGRRMPAGLRRRAAHPAKVRAEAPDVTLSLVVVRWGEPVTYDAEAWGVTGAVVSDPFIDALLALVMGPDLGLGVEVYTVFIHASDDLRRVDPPGGTLRGRQQCALYFLYPCAFQGTACHPGYVNKEDFFAFVRRMERAGIPTRFPHHSHVYQELLSKDWVAHLCASTKFHLPATTKVSRALALSDPHRAAQLAVQTLIELQGDEQGLVDGCAVRGVAKLGYSWESYDVRFFNGVDALATALEALLLQAGCEADFVFVQQRVPVDFEMRLMVVDSAVQHIAYTKFCDFSNNRPEGFQILTDREAVTRQWFAGDAAAFSHAERQADTLLGRWRRWFRTQCAEPPVGFRLDLLVSRPEPGRALVFTGELGELGYSMLSWPAGPATLYRAVLRSCLRDRPCAVPRCPCLATPPPLGTPGGAEGDGEPALKKARHQQ